MTSTAQQAGQDALRIFFEKIRRILEPAFGRYRASWELKEKESGNRLYDNYLSEPKLRSLFELGGIEDSPDGYPHTELFLLLRERKLILSWGGTKRFYKLTKTGRKWMRGTKVCCRDPKWT